MKKLLITTLMFFCCFNSMADINDVFDPPDSPFYVKPEHRKMFERIKNYKMPVDKNQLQRCLKHFGFESVEDAAYRVQCNLSYNKNSQIVDIMSHDWVKEYGKDPLCFAYKLDCTETGIKFERKSDCSNNDPDIKKHKLKKLKYMWTPPAFDRYPPKWRKHDYEKNKNARFYFFVGTALSDGEMISKTCKVKDKSGEEQSLNIKFEPFFANPTDGMSSSRLPAIGSKIGLAKVWIKLNGKDLIEDGKLGEMPFHGLNDENIKIILEYDKSKDAFCRYFYRFDGTYDYAKEDDETRQNDKCIKIKDLDTYYPYSNH